MSLYLEQDSVELKRRFFTLKNPEDIAELLDVDNKRLIYHLYIAPELNRYTAFPIRKASGGKRTILAPITPLKIIQRKLAQVLQSVYRPRAPVHGFTPGRSIVTNAREHTRKRYVLNVDIKDFFPSINFGRVRGMFMAIPYNLAPDVATVLAQICCFYNQLPQGAPTSPVVSNMICTKMDSQLRKLAMENRSFYTRYVDDLTFSTTIKQFPGNLATILPSGDVELGEDLVKLIEINGFLINPSKVRLQTQYQHQEVTGLTTNLFPNVKRKFVRQIRAMLHDWETNGLEAAQQRHRALFSQKHRPSFKEPPPFQQIVKGKIDFLGMVKGHDDPNYRRFLYKYVKLDPDYVLPQEEFPATEFEAKQAIIFTSGKTDWRHISAALRVFKAEGRYTDLDLLFREEDDPIGDSRLATMCEVYSKTPTPYQVPYIFVFDRDDAKILKSVNLTDQDFSDWGNNVYSIALPVPSHRLETPEICIELLYKDEDIKRFDAHRRRIFLTSEFHPDSGRHLEEELNFSIPKKIQPHKLGIIDHDVYDNLNRNVALTKAQFAEYVFEGVDGFDDLEIGGFKPLFDLIETILNTSSA